MFFDASKENIYTLALIACILGASVWTSLVIDKKFAVLERADIRLTQMRYGFGYRVNEFTTDLGSGNSTNLANAAGSLIGINKDEVIYAEASKAVSVPVLVYHGIDDRYENVEMPAFAEHMRILKEHGWQTITLEQFKQFMNGEIELPDKSFVLTFDDGAKASYYPVDPVLKDLGYNAVLFIITSKTLGWNAEVPSRYYLSSTELQYMNDSGRWDIESHGRDDHGYIVIDKYGTKGPYLANKQWLSSEGRLETDEEFRSRIQNDLTGAQVDIENAFSQKKAASFAFPFGDYGQLSLNFDDADAVIKDVTHDIYDMVFYQAGRSDGDTFNYPGTDAFMIKRIEPLPSWTGQELLKQLTSGHEKNLPYHENTFDENWITTWGGADFGETLSLHAKENQTGAAVFLNGSYSWSDYTFTANATVTNDTSLILSARYQNTDNYLSCAFADNRVYIKEQEDDTSITHASREYAKEVQIPNDVPTEVSIDVQGPTVTCMIDGTAVLSADVAYRLSRGGVSMSIWHPEQGTASAIVDSISIE